MWSLLRSNRAFRRLFSAQLVSYAGDWFATVAALGLLLDATGSDLLASVFWVAQTLPTFIMGPIAGPMADRFDRRRILIVVSLLQAVMALTFLLAGHGMPWFVFVAQGSITALGAFFGPAAQAGVANLVTAEELPTAAALMGATWGAMLAVGAALGAAFTVAFGRDAAFLADAVSFLVSAALIISIRQSLQASRSTTAVAAPMRPIRDSIEALRHARRHPTILALLGSHVGFGFGAGVVGLLAVLATMKFDGTDAATGLLLAGRGIGVLIGPLLVRRLARRGIHGVLLACGFAAIWYGTMYLFVSIVPWLALAFLGVALAHFGGGAQWSLTTYGLNLTTPDELRGRIFAADAAFVTLAMSISLVFAGAVSGIIGPSTTIAIIATVSLLWGTVFLILTRTIRADAEAEVAANAPAPLTHEA
ncbi:MAG: MFS transporter [Acidobacteria bacterium]|nr:MFS transporter [Acidobacteriota bacterium]